MPDELVSFNDSSQLYLKPKEFDDALMLVDSSQYPAIPNNGNITKNKELVITSIAILFVSNFTAVIVGHQFIYTGVDVPKWSFGYIAGFF